MLAPEVATAYFQNTSEILFALNGLGTFSSPYPQACPGILWDDSLSNVSRWHRRIAAVSDKRRPGQFDTQGIATSRQLINNIGRQIESMHELFFSKF